MNFDANTQKLVKAWMQAHVMFVGEVVNRLRTVSPQVGHQFDGIEEYFLTPEGIGYHVEHDLDMANGMLAFNAIPGRFVPSNHGAVWVNGKTRLHSEIERRCDQQEGSLIIQ